jgi:hypothetical protein
MNPSIRIAQAPRLGTKIFSLALLVSSTALVPAHSMTMSFGGRPSQAFAESCFRAAVDGGALAAEDVAWSAAGSSTETIHGLARIVIRSSGAIEADVNAFRAILGNPNNGGTPGQQTSGRREVNWDGVPAALSNGPVFPASFFNSNSPRGLEYEVTTGALEVSNQSFADIEPEYHGDFRPFSGTKLFSPVGTNESNIRFFAAGTRKEAAVRGFGVVFADVDEEGSARVDVFDTAGNVIARLVAPVRSERRGASFVGVAFRSAVIGSVRITSGTAPLSPGVLDVSDGGVEDLVVMDDLIYGEPKGL